MKRASTFLPRRLPIFLFPERPLRFVLVHAAGLAGERDAWEARFGPNPFSLRHDHLPSTPRYNMRNATIAISVGSSALMNNISGETPPAKKRLRID